MQTTQIENIVESTQGLIRKDLLLNSDEPLENRYNSALERLNVAKLEISTIEREQKAITLIDGVSILNSHLALVQSQSKSLNKSYEVDYISKTCECPDHKYRGVQCKHILAVVQAAQSTIQGNDDVVTFVSLMEN